jgi:hypothetical protein
MALTRMIKVARLGEQQGQIRSIDNHARSTDKNAPLRPLWTGRAGRLMSRLTDRSTMHSQYIEGLKFFLYVLVVSHVLGCLFYLLATLEFIDCKLPEQGTDDYEAWTWREWCHLPPVWLTT